MGLFQGLAPLLAAVLLDFLGWKEALPFQARAAKVKEQGYVAVGSGKVINDLGDFVVGQRPAVSFDFDNHKPDKRRPAPHQMQKSALHDEGHTAPAFSPTPAHTANILGVLFVDSFIPPFSVSLAVQTDPLAPSVHPLTQIAQKAL
jgi:hypothetical protein